jgi:hypothetical protein
MATKKNENQEPLIIEVDINKFMIDDLELMDKCNRGEEPLSKEIELFDRIVVGGVRGKFKAHEIRNIRTAILDALRNASKNPN